MAMALKRLVYIILSCLGVVATIWLELFVQRKQHLIGGGVNRPFLFLLINVHVVIVVVLLYIIIRQSIKLFSERTKGSAGSVFRSNLAFAFILLSVTPSFFVFFSAGKFITKSIDRWFQARLARGFEHALDLHRQHTHMLRNDLIRYGQGLTLSNAYKPHPPYTVYIWTLPGLTGPLGSLRDEVKQWRVFRVSNDRTMKSLKERFLQKIATASRQGEAFDFYGSLYFVRRVDGTFYIAIYRYADSVRQSLIGLQNSIDDYRHLYGMRDSIYTNYTFTFFAVALLVLFLSLWCAFYLARGMSKPIQELLDATEKVEQGCWDVQVPIDRSNDLYSLASGFNKMAKAVRRAHAQLELKHKEMLAILENLSGAVFWVNNVGRIIFCNAAAQRLLSEIAPSVDIRNKRIWVLGSSIRAKFLGIARELVASGKNQISKEIELPLEHEKRTFFVFGRVLVRSNPDEAATRSLLIVIEDLTDIVKNNRLKTWQEAAKQLAHEIKNPLTPIQLATQRLQRKFATSTHDDSVILTCTTTILQQVQIIRDLVSHFSLFASMPALCVEDVNISQLVEELACLYRVSYPDVGITCSLSASEIVVKTDRTKMRRVLVNLLDNSVRALMRHDGSGKKIVITVTYDGARSRLDIIFSDNGPGIAQSVKDILFLPYVSTEQKNMGLGLAIVHDIIKQMGGTISLVSVKEGATFHIVLPL
ncbi:MAG: ATP-binding protein [Candidatus Babeliales bacterium]|jgi:two-component system nitrogen regulation sensor histidine kinase NtrY